MPKANDNGSAIVSVCYRLVWLAAAMVLNTVLGSTGYAASRAIRALKRPDANVPIIALTADALEESTREAAAAGMDGHLAKPVNPKKLYALLSRVVGKGE